MKELKIADSSADFRFWGGDLMMKEGGHLVKHIKDLAFMGFLEVIFNLRTILGNIKLCKKDIIAYQPDAVILVDYPGFNLRIAKFLKSYKYPVLYYISPQIWAWKQSRVHQIKKYVSKMFTILPFEKDFYRKFDVNVEFVGHPLIDAIENFKSNFALTKAEFFEKYQLPSDRSIVALLPGSRVQEIKQKLPIMISALEDLKNFQIVVAAAPSTDNNIYNSILGKYDGIKIIENDTYNLLNQAKLALVTSGTATLETALFKVPQVVCYKSSRISYLIAKKLIKVKYISLVNLILDKECVKELIQSDLTTKNIKIELNKLSNPDCKTKILKDYESLAEKCGGVGASKITATLMLKTIKSLS